MTREEAIKEFEEQKQIPGTPAHSMCHMLKTAHPITQQKFEEKAINMLIMGSKFASEMTKAGNDPEKRAKLVVAIQEASSGIIKNQSDDDDLPEDLFNAKDL
jgi:hypothetical protein